MHRDKYVDVLKGICIIMIVIIHTEVMGYLEIYRITFFAVPLFFFMSGFYDKNHITFHDFFRKNISAIISPAIIWLVIGILYKGLLSYLKDRTFYIKIDLFAPTYENGPVWFLFALFYVKTIVLFLNRIHLNKYLLIGASTMMAVIGMMYNLPINIDEGFVALPFYYMGSVCYPFIKKTINNRIVLLIGLLFIILFVCETLTFVMLSKKTQEGILLILLSMTGMFMTFTPLLWVGVNFENIIWLQKVGKQSLGIMLTHALLCHTFAVVVNRLFEVGSFPWIIISLFCFIAVCFISYYLSLLISKYCPILFGKKAYKK